MKIRYFKYLNNKDCRIISIEWKNKFVSMNYLRVFNIEKLPDKELCIYFINNNGSKESFRTYSFNKFFKEVNRYMILE